MILEKSKRRQIKEKWKKNNKKKENYLNQPNQTEIPP